MTILLVSLKSLNVSVYAQINYCAICVCVSQFSDLYWPLVDTQSDVFCVYLCIIVHYSNRGLFKCVCHTWCYDDAVSFFNHFNGVIHIDFSVCPGDLHGLSSSGGGGSISSQNDIWKRTIHCLHTHTSAGKRERMWSYMFIIFMYIYSPHTWCMTELHQMNQSEPPQWSWGYSPTGSLQHTKPIQSNCSTPWWPLAYQLLLLLLWV